MKLLINFAGFLVGLAMQLSSTLPATVPSSTIPSLTSSHSAVTSPVSTSSHPGAVTVPVSTSNNAKPAPVATRPSSLSVASQLAHSVLSALPASLGGRPFMPDDADRSAGDENTDYKHIVDVINRCSQAGIWNISFATGTPKAEPTN